MMEKEIAIVDAFTGKPFTGNPAAVCLTPEPLEEAMMQKIAAEFNLSETAFIVPRKDQGESYHIRYFTPSTEISFCGHATLGSFRFLFNKKGSDAAEFLTGSGLHLSGKKRGDEIEMLFPLFTTEMTTVPQGMKEALGISRIHDCGYCHETGMILIEITNPEELRKLTPDPRYLKATTENCNSVIITSPSDIKEYHFLSRCFAPWVGIDEDPVTGSAHSVLAKWWSDRLGKEELRACQVSRRGGEMKLRITGTDTLEVTASAVVVVEGKMR